MAVGVTGADVVEVVALDQHLSAHAGVDRRAVDVLEHVVQHVHVRVPDQRYTGVEVAEVVVVVGDEVRTGVGRVVVADQRRLPVVAEPVPGDGDVLGAVLDVDQAVVVVLVDALLLTAEVVVVDPHVGALLGDLQGVALALRDVVDVQVAENDVLRAGDLEADLVELARVADPEDRHVGDVLDVDLLLVDLVGGDRDVDVDDHSVATVVVVLEQLVQRLARGALLAPGSVFAEDVLLDVVATEATRGAAVHGGVAHGGVAVRVGEGLRVRARGEFSVDLLAGDHEPGPGEQCRAAHGGHGHCGGGSSLALDGHGGASLPVGVRGYQRGSSAPVV